MVKGFHMTNGYKTVEIVESNLYNKKSWDFNFYVDGVLYETKNTEDKSRLIKHLKNKYYFEDNSKSTEK